MRIAVVDGQGGGLGRALVERIKAAFGQGAHVLALGTNALATAAMLRAGADQGASGENAICTNAGKVDVIAGAIGILVADSMLGELSGAMALAIGRSPARKILIPISRCGVDIAGTPAGANVQELIDSAIEQIGRLIGA